MSEFDGKTCEEAGPLSVATYIPCGRPAVALVKNRDPKPYYMCSACAWHNVRNRGAKVLKGEGAADSGREPAMLA